MLNTTKIEKCPHCSSEHIVKNGFAKGKNQSVLCKDCGKSLSNAPSHKFCWKKKAVFSKHSQVSVILTCF